VSCFVKRDVGLGRRGMDKQDCQVRALVTALGLDYSAAWKLLYTMQEERRRCSFGLVDDLALNDVRLRVVQTLALPAVRGELRMNGQKFCRLHKVGNYILRMAHHVAAVVDGNLYDSWDSSRRCVYGAWEVRP
jgi:hypothetical protein